MKSGMSRFLLLITLLTEFVVASCHRQVSTPVFNPAGGTYEDRIEVSITTATPGTTILYTTDGRDPNMESSFYISPIRLTETTTLKAKAFRDGWSDSAMATASYTIEEPPIQMILVPGGTIYPNDGIFTSGLTVSDFYIGKYEITEVDWGTVRGYGDKSNYPKSNVSWFLAISFCNRRSMHEGLTPCYSYLDYGTNPDKWPSDWDSTSDNSLNVSCDWNAPGYRLPTEAEWEYAARGGLQTHGYTYSGSNDLNDVGWYYDISMEYWYGGGDSPHPVGTKAANELGIHDMSGNLHEWCWDVHSGSNRVSRGGVFSGYEFLCAVSYRSNFTPMLNDEHIGFRICRGCP